MSFAGLTRGDKNIFDTSQYGSFNTSNFTKKEKDRNPFDISKDDSIFSIGDLYKSDVAKDFSDKIGVSNPSVEKGDGKGFLGRQIDNYKAYLEATKDDKSEEDKDRDLIRELANKQSMQFGDMTKGFASEVAQGLNVYQPPSPNQQMFIPGQAPTGKSIGQRLAGAAVGLGKGLMTGTPHGGAIGAGIGFFS
tara:strand:- start:49 stop:624 length:576 start_codon:yes stop_codon:yes gene_type:complete